MSLTTPTFDVGMKLNAVVCEFKELAVIQNHETDKYVNIFNDPDSESRYWGGRYLACYRKGNINLQIQVQFCETCGNIDDAAVTYVCDSIRCKCSN